MPRLLPETDRIRDLRGARTPIGADGLAGARRQRLRGRRAEEDVERWVQSACVLCSNGCGLASPSAAAGVLVSQAAQAARDRDLLDRTTQLHDETVTQIKWLKTKLKEASPQVLVGMAHD